MSSAKFTLFGAERYFNNLNQSLFDNLRVPEGLTKETLTNNILMRGGEFEVMYGDPEFMRFAIGAWSDKWMPTMQRWVDALAIEYNPLENYDRMEDWTDNVERSDASSSGRNLDRSEGRTHDESEAADSMESTLSHENASYEQSDAKSSTSDNDSTSTFDRDKYSNPPTHTTKKSAYDQSTYSPYSEETDSGKWEEKTDASMKSSESGASSSNSSGTADNSVSGSTSRANTSNDNSSVDESETMDTSSAMNNDSVHSGRIHGNIGTMTSQEMLRAELELGYWNIYEKTTELFLQEFTIPVYS